MNSLEIIFVYGARIYLEFFRAAVVFGYFVKEEKKKEEVIVVYLWEREIDK